MQMSGTERKTWKWPRGGRAIVPLVSDSSSSMDVFSSARCRLVHPPGIQSFPEELVKAAAELRGAQEEYERVEEAARDLQNASYKSRHDEAKLDKIVGELKPLEGEERVMGENIAARRRSFLAAAISHSRAYCRDMSEKIVQGLPREIRDMIYGYLCDRMQRVSIRPSQADQDYPWRTAESREASDAAGWPYLDRIETPLPYLFSSKYFQKVFLKELSSALYRTARFHIWDPEDLIPFLTQDVLRTDLIPKDHARNLALVVFTDEFGHICSSKRQIRSKLSRLQRLFDIKHQKDFNLDLYLCISRMRHRPNVARFHQILLPYLCDLHAAGFAMRFPLKKFHFDEKRRSDRWQMNQLQAGGSTDPEDWIVDEEELEDWKASEEIQNAFMKSARHRQLFLGYASDYDSDGAWDDYESNWERPLPEDFEEGSVGEDEGDLELYREY